MKFTFSVIYLSLFLNYYLAMWNHWNDHVLGWWERRHDSDVLFLTHEDLQMVCAFKLCLSPIPPADDSFIGAL